MIHEFKNPISVITPLGEGMAIYVRDNSTWEDDVWAVALMDGGQVRHFLSHDIKIWSNSTYGINKN